LILKILIVIGAVLLLAIGFIVVAAALFIRQVNKDGWEQ
jgi:hypothetical protein